MTVGVNYGYTFVATPKVAVDGDRVDIRFGLQALDGSDLPLNTNVRINIEANGINNFESGSRLINMNHGPAEIFIARLSVGRGGGSIRVTAPEVFIGDEDAPRTVNGAQASIRVLPQSESRPAPEPSDTIQVLPARNRIYDGQTALFYITGRGQHLYGLDYGIGFSAPGITEIGNGCNGGTVWHQWTGGAQTPYCTARTSGFINPGGEDAETVASRGVNTGVNARISEDGWIRYTITNTGGDMGQVDVIARTETVIDEGEAGEAQEIPDRRRGWEQIEREPESTRNNPPFVPIDDDEPEEEKITVCYTGDTTALSGVSISSNICAEFKGNEQMGSGSEVTGDDESEYIPNTDEDLQAPIIHGSTILRKKGDGKVTLDPNNTMSGDIHIEQGILESPNGGLGNSSNIYINDGTTLQFNNEPEKVTVNENIVFNLLGNATISNINGVTDHFGTIHGDESSVLNIVTNNNGNNIFGGIRFSSNHPNFIGTTIIHENAELTLDTLPDSSSNDVHNGDIEVIGALKGNGTINGNVTVRDGGYLLLGAEVGTETHITGDLTLESGCHVFLSLLQNSSDTLRVDGNIIIQDNVELVLTPFQNTTMNNSYTFVNYGGTLTGTFSTVTNFRDTDSENGVDDLPDSEYPSNLDYNVNGIITGNK